jgi:hypothetical protein
MCAGQPGTPLAVLVRVEGARWGVEEAIQTAKGDAGLDHYEVRRYDAWYRHVTLSLLAAAFLTVQRAAAGERGRGGDHAGCAGGTERAGELRRLLARLVWPPPSDPTRVLAWSLWRRRHQARARRAHQQRRQPLAHPT